MDFLESAVILIPSLTGMAVTVYDGDVKVLEGFADKYESSSIVNKRYYLEERFIKAVSCGETEKALSILGEVKGLCADLRFMSSELRDQIAGVSIVRTLVRMGARMAGLGPILIDSISQEYTQRM